MSSKGFGKQQQQPSAKSLSFTLHIIEPGQHPDDALMIPVEAKSYRELALVIGKVFSMNRHLFDVNTQIWATRTPVSLADTDDDPEQTAKTGKVLAASIEMLPSVFTLQANGRILAQTQHESLATLFQAMEAIKCN